VRRLRDPRVFGPILGVLVIILGTAISDRWTRGPQLAKADYVGTTDVSADDAKLYRDVPFDWKVAGLAGAFKGSSAAHIRVDSSGERTFVCGWLKRNPADGASRASRWLSAARLQVGDQWIAATFIATTDKAPGEGLNAGCARLDASGAHPADNAPLKLDGPPVHE
jgi:hypothetical protein